MAVEAIATVTELLAYIRITFQLNRVSFTLTTAQRTKRYISKAHTQPVTIQEK